MGHRKFSFARLFGFAGLFIDEMLMSILRWWRGMQLPYFVPRVWYVSSGIALAVGFGIGVGLALWTLSVRGLL